MKKEIEAVAAVIERDGRFLITRRLETSPLGHCWEFPGGKIERGETVEACAVRECLEEIDVTVEALSRLREEWYDYPHGRVHLHFVLCRIISGDPKPIQCSQTRWIAPAELKHYRFPPADERVIRDLVKNFRSFSFR